MNLLNGKKSNELLRRLLVALIGIPIAIFIIYTGDILFYAAVVVISAWSLYEFYGIADMKAVATSKQFGIITGAFLQILFLNIITSGNYRINSVLLAAIILLFFIIMADVLFTNKPYPILSFATSVSGLFYIPILLTGLIGLREFHKINPEYLANSQESGIFVLGVFATVWVCDSAAYFVGRAMGKRKLYEKISPKKTIEGGVAGLIASIIFFFGYNFFFEFIPIVHGAIIGALIGVFGQLGDLFESMLKRDAGLKDSSNLLPGHGGMLDRFDSMIFAAPIVFIYLLLFTFG